MRRVIAFFIVAAGILLAFVAQVSIAQDIAPDVLVKSVTNEVIADIKKSSGVHDSAKLAALVETTILPHFDFSHMTRLAMGRNWRVASPQQQQALIAEFKTLLVHTYSASLALYQDQKIEFSPPRAKPGATDATVRSIVKKPGTDPVNIDYDMEKESAGWKVYDVSIDGISLVITYRDTFNNQVGEHGVDGLIKSLADKNSSNAKLT